MKHISDYDDAIVASLVHDFRKIARLSPTISQITACYNILCGLLNLCAVNGDKESLTVMVNNLHDGLLNHVNDICD